MRLVRCPESPESSASMKIKCQRQGSRDNIGDTRLACARHETGLFLNTDNLITIIAINIK